LKTSREKPWKPLRGQDRDVEHEQDQHLGGQGEPEHLGAHRHLEVGQQGDDRVGDQRPDLPGDVYAEAGAGLAGEVGQRAEDADGGRVVGQQRDVGGGPAGPAAQALAGVGVKAAHVGDPAAHPHVARGEQRQHHAGDRVGARHARAVAQRDGQGEQGDDDAHRSHAGQHEEHDVGRAHRAAFKLPVRRADGFGL